MRALDFFSPVHSDGIRLSLAREMGHQYLSPTDEAIEGEEHEVVAFDLSRMTSNFAFTATILVAALTRSMSQTEILDENIREFADWDIHLPKPDPSWTSRHVFDGYESHLPHTDADPGCIFS